MGKKVHTPYQIDITVMDTENETAFRDLLDILNMAIQLSRPDPKKRVCLHRDVSDMFSARIVTQAKSSELSKNLHVQKHDSLGFVDGEFTDSEGNWSPFEKRFLQFKKRSRK